jgi:hypothetical protein
LRGDARSPPPVLLRLVRAYCLGEWLGRSQDVGGVEELLRQLG